MNAVVGELIPKTAPIAAYDPFRSQLAELEQHNKTAVFDYASKTGNKEARSHVYKLRQTKSAIDKVRKEQKAEALEYGRRVDGEAKEIVDRIESMIELHQKPLDEIEAAQAKLKEYAESTILETRHAADSWHDKSVECLRDRLTEIQAIEATEEKFGDYLDEMKAVQAEAVTKMQEVIGLAEKRDANAAELARHREEQEARARQEREEQLRREGEERAQREAAEKVEKQRREAEVQLAREREERERAEAARVAAEQRADRERQESEAKAAKAAKDAEERLLREQEAARQREAEEQRKRDTDIANRKKVNNAAAKAIAAVVTDEKMAQEVVKLIASGKVPAVSIKY
jgi:hypothetical protein